MTYVLVAAGNYNIVREVRDAIDDPSMRVIATYSHRDMLAMLSQQRFAAIIVDAAMFDRYTGESSLAALDRIKNPLPRIAIAIDERDSHFAHEVGAQVVRKLDMFDIRAAMSSVLGRTLPNRSAPPGTADLITKQRIDELATMLKVARSMTEALDLERVLNNVVNAAQELTDAEEAMILLPDTDNHPPQFLILRAKTDMNPESDANFRIRIEGSSVGRVYTEGNPTLNNRDRVKLKTEYLVNSLLYVPIKLENRTIGVLGVSNVTRSASFTIHHQEQLMSLASFAAIAIQNASAHEEALARTRDLENLVRASQVMTVSLSINETFANICEQICKTLSVSRTEIYHATHHYSGLSRRAQFLSSMWRPLKGPTMQLSAANVQNMFSNGAVAGKEQGQQFIMLPIISQERLQAVLKLMYLQKPEAIKKEARLKAIDEGFAALAVLLTSPDLKHGTQHAEVIDKMTQLNTLVGADWSEIWLTEDHSPTCYLMARVGSVVWREEPFPRLAAEKVPSYVEALENNQVTQFADETERHMAIPFTYGDNYIGLILIHDDKPIHPFSQREIEVAKALAGQAMRALDNARLHSSLQEKHEQLRSMQDKLIENARFTAMGEMAATVAHQINNPLTTIMAEAELLKEFEQPNTDRYEQLEAIHRNGKRAADYAKRLLFMVRPTDNKDPVPVNVLETLREVIGMVSSPRARRAIQLTQKLPKDNDSYPPVMAVQGQLDDVWLNLLNNAYEALDDKQGASITVETRYDPDARQIVVRISDNGPGMPKEVYERIFQPFFTTKDYGTGLGLHICRQIIEQVSGKIEVQSFVGQGTRFTVTLPVVSEKSHAIMQEDAAL